MDHEAEQSVKLLGLCISWRPKASDLRYPLLVAELAPWTCRARPWLRYAEKAGWGLSFPRSPTARDLGHPPSIQGVGYGSVWQTWSAVCELVNGGSTPGGR